MGLILQKDFRQHTGSGDFDPKFAVDVYDRSEYFDIETVLLDALPLRVSMAPYIPSTSPPSRFLS